MKKIIAVAIAALPMAAMADVQIYGQLEASVEAGNTFGYGDVFNTNTRVDDTGSKIGFKGTEDLGNGLKAIWQVESYLSIDGTDLNGDTRANKFAGRDSFVGLQGDWGKVRLGRLSTYQNDSMERFDPWTYGKGVNGMSYTSANTMDGRINNAVRYDTPNLNGFKAAVLYGTDEVRAVDANGDRRNSSVWNLGASYDYAGYFVSAGYTHQGDANQAGDKSANYWRLEGGYEANNLLVALAYGQSKTFANSAFGSGLIAPAGYGFESIPVGSVGAVGANDAMKAKELALTVAYTIGNFTPRFSYARVFDIRVQNYATGTTNDYANNSIDQFVLGVDYALSKRTMAYASYGYVNHDATFKAANETESSENTFALGLVHKF